MAEIEDAFVVCREVNSNTGEVIVYDIGWVVKDDVNLTRLQLRQRYNANLKYYAMSEEGLNSKEYVVNLIKKGISSILYTYV